VMSLVGCALLVDAGQDSASAGEHTLACTTSVESDK
jgi:hypothetical protein